MAYPHEMGRVILAWDAPNIDMTLSTLLGRRPGPNDRPDMRAVIRWLAEQRGPDDRLEISVFVNVNPDQPQALQGWIAFLQSIGIRVFAKPKTGPMDDIDEAMVDYIRSVSDPSSKVFLASNDARRFTEPVRQLATSATLTVLGFVELAGELADAHGWSFVDLEDLPGVIPGKLIRTRLDTLPTDGAWLEPRMLAGRRSPESLRPAVGSAARSCP